MVDKSNGVADSVMQGALQRFEESEAATAEDRDTYKEDWKFARLAEQWPAAIKKQRVQEARPVLVINKLPSFIRSVVNESRQNRPSIKVSPVDNFTDENSAEVISGLIRSIERGSNARLAYDTAIDQAVTGGFGFFRIVIDYCSIDSFYLEARIERIPFAPQVHWDPSSTAFDSSDWEFAFISSLMTKRQYEEKYPEGTMTPFEGTLSDTAYGVSSYSENIRISEYFLREPNKREIILLGIPNPQTGEMRTEVFREDLLEDMAREFFEAADIDPGRKKDKQIVQAWMEIAGIQEMERREVDYFKIKRRVLNGVEVLEEEDWPGQTIPICPVWGDEVFDELGRRHFRSLIRDAKDPQVMFNFWRSATTELVAMAPKAPWVGPKGFVPDEDRTKWDSANTRSHQYLEYEWSSGQPAPSRNAFAGVPTGALQESLSANDDMKAIMGIYDSSLGARSNETSGKAIMARERQGDVSNYHFISNLARSIASAGRILVEIIPSVYSARGAIRILGEDKKEEVIQLTQEAGGSHQEGMDGAPKLYNLSVGKFDITVDTGPSFTTAREETRETLIEIMRQVPEAAQFLGDVLLDHMDFAGADKVAKRLNQLLPPEIRELENAELSEGNPEAAQLQQQLKAQQQEFAQIKEQVMAEIEKITLERDALKNDRAAQMAKVQVDSANNQKKNELKERELDLSEIEANTQPEPPTVEQKFQHERNMADDDRIWRAEQNQLDRMTDITKAIINKAEDDDSPEDKDAAISEAMDQAAEITPQ